MTLPISNHLKTFGSYPSDTVVDKMCFIMESCLFNLLAYTLSIQISILLPSAFDLPGQRMWGGCYQWIASLFALVCCAIAPSFSPPLSLQRKKGGTEGILEQAQWGFRANRRTTNQIFTLKKLTEKYEEFGKKLTCYYINYRNVFNSM